MRVTHQALHARAATQASSPRRRPTAGRSAARRAGGRAGSRGNLAQVRAGAQQQAASCGSALGTPAAGALHHRPQAQTDGHALAQIRGCVRDERAGDPVQYPGPPLLRRAHRHDGDERYAAVKSSSRTCTTAVDLDYRRRHLLLCHSLDLNRSKASAAAPPPPELLAQLVKNSKCAGRFYLYKLGNRSLVPMPK
eukprot:COSAG01_NODE_1796_length_9212_cov_45.060573_9_plen_194_part_00